MEQKRTRVRLKELHDSLETYEMHAKENKNIRNKPTRHNIMNDVNEHTDTTCQYSKINKKSQPILPATTTVNPTQRTLQSYS